MSAPTQIEKDHYARLIGYTIIGINWDSIDNQPLPVLVLNGEDRDGNAPAVAVLCDPEGNGSGFLEHNL